jgi:lysophospholipase L1-like esterase
MFFQPRQTIVFAGDSITDCGRHERSARLGNGYVRLVNDLLQARYPELGLRIVNRGVSGDTTRDLQSRWERDVLSEQPDAIAIFIGINDVWRAFSNNPIEAVPLPEYEATLRRLSEQTRSAGKNLILITPYMIEGDRSVPMRRQMDWYGDAVRRLAAELDAPLVDTQAAFDAVLAHSAPVDWAGDQIHPNGAGHAVIALAFLRAVGFDLAAPKPDR